MKLFKSKAAVFFSSACLSIAILPALSHGQNRPQGDGAGQVMPMRQVLKELDLSDEQKTKIQGIMRQAATDAQEARQGIQDATPQERKEKAEEVTKIMSVASDKVVGELTPEQKTKYFPLLAKAQLTAFQNTLKTMQSASAKVELSDDVRGQLKSLVDDTQKKLDSYQTDADGVKDAKTESDLQTRLMEMRTDTLKQMVSIVGAENMKEITQKMREEARNNRAGTSAGNTPSTKPADK